MFDLDSLRGPPVGPVAGWDPRPGRSVPDTLYASEVADLFVSHSRRLRRLVRNDVRAREVVIEDACQFAWAQLVDHAERVRRETALSWLAKTAVHEALKLLRRDAAELPLGCGEQSLTTAACDEPGPSERVEHRERLRPIRHLPERQQRIVWLQALGLTYAEIAAHDRCTVRTVERQLLRAKAALRLAERE